MMDDISKVFSEEHAKILYSAIEQHELSARLFAFVVSELLQWPDKTNLVARPAEALRWLLNAREYARKAEKALSACIDKLAEFYNFEIDEKEGTINGR